MIELIKLGEKTYYLKNTVNIGVYLLNDSDVCVIDTGNSKDFGKVIESVLNDNNWNLKYIINTHSHSDHIGGNKYLQDKYKCHIFSSKIESYFINEPLLEPSMLYSANPLKGMHSHFLEAEPSESEDIKNLNLDGIEIINLEGHSVGQIGVVTSDNVCFVGDAYTSTKIISKYSIQYVFNIEKYLKTLEYLKSTKYNYYVPAHGEVENNCMDTINTNIENINNIEEKILNIVNKGIKFEDLLKNIFIEYHIKMNVIQYHLISATIKSFLTKLENENKIEIQFENNEMYIKTIH